MDSQKQSFSLSSLLLVCATVPIWLYLMVALPQSPGFGGSPTRFLIPPIALTGIAAAIHRLVRGRPNAIAISALFAPVIAIGALVVASFLAG